MSLFLRRSLSESSENLPRSPSLASIRENSSPDAWSTHENIDDRDEKVVGRREYKNLNRVNLINYSDDVSEIYSKLIIKLPLERLFFPTHRWFLAYCYHNKNHLLLPTRSAQVCFVCWQSFFRILFRLRSIEICFFVVLSVCGCKNCPQSVNNI